MILTFFQLGTIAALAVYLGRWKATVHRRNSQSWDSLLARLRTDWRARELSEHFRWKEGLNAMPEETWKRIQDVHGLWAMYQNSRVMLEMADYAARNSDSVDHLLLETFRNDAVQIRVCVMLALVEHAYCNACEGVRVKAFRAASMYTGMAARMTKLLQENAAIILPGFVAAM